MKNRKLDCLIVPKKDKEPEVYAIANEVLSNGTFGIVKTVHQLDQPAPPMVVKIPRYDSTDNPEERQEIDAMLMEEPQILRSIYGDEVYLDGIQPLPHMAFDLTRPYRTALRNVAPTPKGVIMLRFHHDLWDEISQCREDGSPLSGCLLDRTSSTIALTYVDVCLQLFRGLATLSKKNRNHQDIKPNNIGVSLPKRVFLIDWGLSKDLNKFADVHLATKEFVWEADRDFWDQFKDRDQLTDYHKLADNHVPEELVSLIEDCLCPSYQSRPTAQQAVDRLIALQTKLSESKK